jgi:hypothetical protein
MPCGICEDADKERKAEYKADIVNEEGAFVVVAYLCWPCKTAFEWGQARQDAEVSPIVEGVKDDS